MLKRERLTKSALNRKLQLSAAETNPSIVISKIMGLEMRFKLVAYNNPDRADMAVIIPFFNPAHSVRIFQNLLTVKNLLECAKIPVFIGEVAYKDEPFSLPPAENIFQWRSSSYMFYKENIFNTVLPHISALYTKIMILDCDVVFENPDWYNIVVKDLDKSSVIQPFETAHFLNTNFTIAKSKTSYAKSPHNGHIGFGAAFQRSWLGQSGLYNLCLVGSGDAHLLYHFHNKTHASYTNYSSDYQDWRNSKPIVDLLRFSELVVYHLPHGSEHNRHYIDRHARFLELVQQFRVPKISMLVEQSAEGIFDWKPEYRLSLNTFMKQYFNDRDDDGHSELL